MTTKELRVNYFLPIVIGIIISIVFDGLLICYLYNSNILNNKKIHLNELINSNVNKYDKKTYLKVKSISPKIASKDKDNGYYIVSDGKYNYVVLMSDKKVNELIEKDLENNPVEINGISKEMTNKLKDIVISKYNSTRGEKISLKEYYSYFGDVYLDQTLAFGR